MSEQLSIYIHKVGDEILPHKEFDGSVYRGGDVAAYVDAVNKHNDYLEEVSYSYGVMLMYLSTTPSRRLSGIVPYNDTDAKPFTKEMLKSVIDFYVKELDEQYKIRDSYSGKIANDKSLISTVTSANIFRELMSDIDSYNQYIEEVDEEIDEIKFHLNQFEMVENILNINDGYELLYTRR